MKEAIVFLAAPAVLSVLLVMIHSYLGLHVLKREIIFVDIGLSQVAALGATVSMFFMPEGEGYLGIGLSLLFCLLAALGLALLRRFEKKIPQEVLIGMTYALASGLLILAADKLAHGTEHLKHALIGNILFVTWEQVIETFFIYLVVAIIHWVFRNHFWASTNGQDDSFLWNFLFYLLFGVVITFSTHHAGVLVVFSILVMPAALARRYFNSLQNQLLAAWLIGLLSVISGFVISYQLDLPTGAVIVALMTTLFFTILGATLLFEEKVA